MSHSMSSVRKAPTRPFQILLKNSRMFNSLAPTHSRSTHLPSPTAQFNSIQFEIEIEKTHPESVTNPQLWSKTNIHSSLHVVTRIHKGPPSQYSMRCLYPTTAKHMNLSCRIQQQSCLPEHSTGVFKQAPSFISVSLHLGATVVQEEEESFSYQMVASLILNVKVSLSKMYRLAG